MKKLIIAALLVVSVVSFAQDKKDVKKRGDRADMEKMTPEQRNELALKKMTLDLDLNAKQQEQMKAVIAEQTARREAMRAERKANQEKATTERFDMKSKMMDEQIKMKEKMKTILTPAQLTKWEDLQKQQQERRGGMGWNREGGRDRGDGQGPGQGNDEN